MSLSFSVTGLVSFAPAWTDTDADNFVNVLDSSSVSIQTALTNGTGDDQANGYWRDVVTIAAAGTYSADLKALPRQVMGGTADTDFAKVKLLAVRNLSDSATLDVGDTITDRWTALSASPITLGPDAVLYVVHPNSGYTVGASDKVLAITNNGGSAADVELYVVGVLA